MRRIGPRGSGRAKAGASSHGSASDTPAARRKLRRSTFMASPSLGPSFGPEEAGLDHLMDQRPKAIVLAADLANDRVDLGPVGPRRRSAGRVRQEPGRQGPRDLVLVA